MSTSEMLGGSVTGLVMTSHARNVHSGKHEGGGTRVGGCRAHQIQGAGPYLDGPLQILLLMRQGGGSLWMGSLAV